MTTVRTLAKNFLGGVLLVLLLGGTFAGCTAVKFVQRNPYTGEIWTVYQHTLGPDTLTYCPPIDGSACLEAEFLSEPPPQGSPAISQPGMPVP